MFIGIVILTVTSFLILSNASGTNKAYRYILVFIIAAAELLNLIPFYSAWGLMVFWGNLLLAVACFFGLFFVSNKKWTALLKALLLCTFAFFEKTEICDRLSPYLSVPLFLLSVALLCAVLADNKEQSVFLAVLASYFVTTVIPFNFTMPTAAKLIGNGGGISQISICALLAYLTYVVISRLGYATSVLSDRAMDSEQSKELTKRD